MRKGLNKIKDEYQNLLLLFIDSLTKEFFNWWENYSHKIFDRLADNKNNN